MANRADAADWVDATLAQFSRAFELGLQPRHPACAAVSWAPRILTTAPDLLCNASMDTRRDLLWLEAEWAAKLRSGWMARFIGDGACRESCGSSAYATCLVGFPLKGGAGQLLALRSTQVHVEGSAWGPAWKMEVLAIEAAVSLLLYAHGWSVFPAQTDARTPSPTLLEQVRLALHPWCAAATVAL